MASADPVLRRLIDQIQGARVRKSPLRIQAGDSKRFYGEATQGEPLDVRPLAGISSYEPSELVVTVRAGTPLAELEQILSAHGQCLAFEPPRYALGGTVGGMVAAGLAGPARASAGSVRDHVLGMTVLNGKGEVLSFGGQVAKNVAGYDVTRLMVGALGILGVILEVSLKVLPMPLATAGLSFSCTEADALERLARWASRPLPINATAWHDNRLFVRLCGARAAVREACAVLGGEDRQDEGAQAFWSSVRDHKHAFFRPAADQSLWRLSVPARSGALALSGDQFIEWHGALRWWTSSMPAVQVRDTAAQAGGHATLMRGPCTHGVFHPLPPVLMAVHRRLKTAFDPDGLLNRGRLYRDL
jgi:FAD/FMN-containing dehydrogenase